ncbi:unnamed protein product [Cuscuta europaea]|uniref:TMEM205-like domain-containing protein n=1 Tax=Cuscuta europaea TaxID=41803 RepID=A0A9P1EK39_CUSEU|nr:unnamed protein product [Cuscuta europaea]
MMNVLALSLVLTTLVTAGVWSPPPQEKAGQEDVIVKEGHRVVVVEYEKDHGWNTKVSISPHEITEEHKNPTPVPEREETADGGGSDDSHLWMKKKTATPRELVCDAYGKCKHRIAGALGLTKDAAAEKARDVAGKAKEGADIAHEAEEGTRHAVGDVAGNAGEWAAEKAYDMKERTTQTVGEGLEKARRTATKMAGDAAEKAQNTEKGVRHAVGDGLGKARDGVAEMARKAYNLEEDTRDTVGEGLGNAKDGAAEISRKATEMAGDAAERAYNVEEKTRHTIGEGLGKARDMARAMAGKAYSTEEGTRRAVKDGIGKARDTVVDKGHRAAEKVYEVEEGARESVKEHLSTAAGEVKAMKREVSENVKKVKETMKEKIVKSMEKASGMANLVGLATAYGMSVWVTFVSSYVLARALPRHQFAVTQSKIYPVYFKAMAYSIGTAFLGHLLSQSQRVEKFMGFNLLLPLVMVLVNLLYLEPRATKVMFERMKMEKEEGRGKEGHVDRLAESDSNPAGALTAAASKKQQERAEGVTKQDIIRMSKRLKRLNSYSSFLNVATLMSLTLYLASLGHRLHTPCM